MIDWDLIDKKVVCIGQTDDATINSRIEMFRMFEGSLCSIPDNYAIEFFTVIAVRPSAVIDVSNALIGDILSEKESNINGC